MQKFIVSAKNFSNFIYHYKGRQNMPLRIYSGHIVVPLALVQYYPLLYLLDIETGLPYMLAPLGGLRFALPAYGFWRFGLKRYTSTGS